MKAVWKKIDRIVYVLLAIALAYLLFYGITKLSEKAQGPLASMADRIEEWTYNLEHKAMVQAKEDSRSNGLAWFQPIANSKNSLLAYNSLLLGISDDFTPNSYETMMTMEDSLGIHFSLIHFYVAWGSKPEQQFPMLEAKVISDLGSVPVITWEPWVTDFDVNRMGLSKEMNTPQNSMWKVAQGNYDTYIREWAQKAKRFGKPIYLRWGHEMNDPTRYPWGAEKNKAADYVRAWQHVHDLFGEEGANNVIWVWSPHLSYGSIDRYYPGDAYVDMVGCTVLNYGTTVNWSDWWSFEQIFGTHYQAISAFQKPIMIAEFGSVADGGDRVAWYRDAMQQVADRYKNVQALLFFNYAEDRTVTDRALNWSIDQDREVLQEVKNKLSNVRNK